MDAPRVMRPISNLFRLDVAPGTAAEPSRPELKRAVWRLLPYGCVAGAAAILIFAPAGQQLGRYGAFAGYTTFGPVRSIAASWTVPRTLGGPATASAATWIGVQSQSMHGPFVQVGTQEEGSGRDFAFWSDPERHFAPQFLGFVAAGDDVSARLVRIQDGWAATLYDPPAAARIVTIQQPAGARFDQAEWFQEDPSQRSRTQRVPYPTLAALNFRSLRLNRAAPGYAALYAQWMSLPGGKSLAPTALAGDAFGLQWASVSHAGQQFLSDAARALHAYLGTLHGANAWSRPSVGTIAAANEADVVAAGWLAETAQLRSQHWPAGVTGDLRRLVGAQRRIIAELHALARLPRSRRADWRIALVRDVQTQLTLSHELARALRVPELIP
jgi:hypothetical protein